MFLNKIKSLFSSESERTALVKKNIVGTFFIRGGGILISFFLVPLTIDYVSNEVYGIWVTIFSIAHWISLFDIGFGNGLRNRIAENVAVGDKAKVKQYISTTYACLTLIFVPIALILFFVCQYINWPSLLSVDAIWNEEIIRAMQIVLILFCITIIVKIQGTVLNALQLNALTSVIETAGQFLVLITIIILKSCTSGSLTILAFVISICPIISYMIAYFWMYKLKYPDFAPSFKAIKFSFAKDILNLGIKFFIIQIATVVLYGAINVIISHVSGPENVTEYNVVHKYLTVPMFLFGIIVAPLWSAYTDAFTKKDYNWMQSVHNKMFRMMILMLILLVALMLLYPIAFKIWLGSKVTIHLPMVLFVGLYIATMIWNNLYANIINGVGKIKIQLITSIICVIFNIPLALFFGYKFGAVGVVASTCLMNLLPLVCLTVQVKKILSTKAIGIWNE